MVASQDRVLNCVPSHHVERDWTVRHAVGLHLADEAGGASIDLRREWWRVGDQRDTGSCVGWAVEAVARYHLVIAGLLPVAVATHQLSVRHLWLAAKHTRSGAALPTADVDSATTTLKAALSGIRKHGVVREDLLSFDGGSYHDSPESFYLRAARHRIPAYLNLGHDDPGLWVRWLRAIGPLVVRVEVDHAWLHVSADGALRGHDGATVRGGHAACLVGWHDGRFIVRNSWGVTWGDRGFAYATPEYAAAAFTESYGVLSAAALATAA